ncbi:MAG: 50S ribosomal protein L19 [Candidatus Omnitrophica bacterium]|jgi:large subunit ribosomal protein L19|nr:50S ribosomal protein L19 [Candidatus Omnitrophota bacterium]
MDMIKMIEDDLQNKKIPKLNVGDTVKVMTKIPEGDKVRLHPFEGVIISKKGSGTRMSFTVRKVSYGEGIERIFSIYSPVIERIDVLRRGKVQRAKLFYLRGKIGKKATKIESVEEKDITGGK